MIYIARVRVKVGARETGTDLAAMEIQHIPPSRDLLPVQAAMISDPVPSFSQDAKLRDRWGVYSLCVINYAKAWNDATMRPSWRNSEKLKK